MSNKPALGGINAILRKQREEAISNNTKAEGSLLVRETSENVEPEIRVKESLVEREVVEGINTGFTSSQEKNSFRPPHFSDPNHPGPDLNTLPPIGKAPASTESSPTISTPKHSNKSKPDNITNRDTALANNSEIVVEQEGFSLGDKVLKLGLSGNELKLYDYIYRHTLAIKQPNCRVNIKDLQLYLGLTQMSVFRILNRLETKQAIKRKKLEQNRLLIGIELTLII